MKITIVYDNKAYSPDFESGWGFSALVEVDEKKILFDTGDNGQKLLLNMKKLGIDPKTINIVVLSHDHWDHIDGMNEFLKENSSADVYVLKSFTSSFESARIVEVDKPVKVLDSVQSTGELVGAMPEQSLLVDTLKGLVVITGCSHPGIVHILETAKQLAGEKIHLVIGGFHLGDASDSEIKQIVSDFRRLGVEKAGPCHCTGEKAMQAFKEEYQADYVEIGAGKVLEVK